MEPSLQISAWRVAATIVAVLFEALFPPAVAWFINRRLHVSWRYFAYGAIIFLLFQLISRVPIVLAIQGALAPQLQASRPLLFGWLTALALTAGLAEEIGRYVGYRWLFREERTWSRAVMYGLGHGGLESTVLVAGLTLLGLINLLALSAVDRAALPLTDEQRELARQQLAAVAAQPDWLPLVGAWERLWTLPVHVALSVMVVQVFQRGQIWWLWLAVAAHTLVNLLAVGVAPAFELQGTAAILIPEVIVALAGMAGLWIIWRLREES
ncbi:MAG: YhfC family intramembrane metalloprotease [Roseiflexus sp.]|nr:YhfC family intramembrane metalloprotease [Roseiflexus sp.]MCS7287865.1 YhfC family intramembrane metalloprotease [Roseiflexus sp.]MDW8232532.1 YhfC family glutamic-type intramembrane protease [Roseiflexaceae bacterium]